MNRQFGSSRLGNNAPGNIQPGSAQSGNIQLGNIQSGNLDVIGKAQGLQIRLKKVGAFFTQEIVYPGETDPLVGGDNQDIHVVVDGKEIYSAYTYAGVSQKPQGSLYLQAVLEHADFSVETNFKLSVRSGFLDVETIFTAHRPLVLSAIENNYFFMGAAAAEKISASGTPGVTGVEGAQGEAGGTDVIGAAGVTGLTDASVTTDPTSPNDAGDRGYADSAAPPPMMDAKYVWLPHLKKAAGHVAGQHSFRSPCAYIRQGADTFAIIPSLTALRASWKDNWGAPAVLDYEEPNCLRFGLAKHVAAYQPGENLYFRRLRMTGKESADGLNLSSGEKVSYSFSLMLRKDSAAGTAQGEIVRFIWEKYGMQLLEEDWHQYLRFDDCVRYAYDALFDRCRSWRAFSLNGVDCGGMVALVTRKHGSAFQNQNDNRFAAEIPWKRYLLDRHARNRLELATKWLFDGTLERIYFDARHNNLRIACGLAYFGARWNDQKLIDAARRIVNLYLTAPETPDGLRPAVFSIGSRPGWLNGVDGWAITEAYGVADLAEAGYWLLNYYVMLSDEGANATEAAGASRVLAVCARIAETLRKKQTDAGFYRRYFQENTSEHSSNGAFENMCTADQGWFSAYATAAAGRFMAAMAQVTGDLHIREGAVKAARFIANQVLPEHDWSGSRGGSGSATGSGIAYGQSTPSDYYGGLKPQDCNTIYLAADLFRILTKLTGEKYWLDSGKATLDDLLLYQQLWTPPHLLLDGTGGFGAGNIEGVWNSPHQAMIALMLMDWYELSGEEEYFKRGILALRASYAAMLAPENKLMHEELHGQFGTADYGIIVDNYAHAGSDTGFGARVIPGWGCGTACAATALAQKYFGDVYIDIPRKKAFGINGCRVKEALLSPTRVVLRIETMPDYDEPKHGGKLNPNITNKLILKFRVGSEDGGKLSGSSLEREMRNGVAGGDGWFSAKRDTSMDGELIQVSVNGERLGYYNAAQLREGISWDWRNQRYQAEEVQNAPFEENEGALGVRQEVELDGLIERVTDDAADAAVDSADATVDAAPDAGLDTGTDTGTDIGTDTGLGADAGAIPADNLNEPKDEKAQDSTTETQESVEDDHADEDHLQKNITKDDLITEEYIVDYDRSEESGAAENCSEEERTDETEAEGGNNQEANVEDNDSEVVSAEIDNEEEAEQDR